MTIKGKIYKSSVSQKSKGEEKIWQYAICLQIMKYNINANIS